MTVDVVLLERARSGEPAAILSLLTQTRPELVRYAQRSCMISDVDDAVQEAMLVVSRTVSLLRHPRAWSRWVFRIMRRACHRLARTALRQDLWDDDAVAAALTYKADDELRRDLSMAIEALPESYREVVVLRDLEGLTIGELARRLGTTRAAVKGRLHRARELTREYLIAN